MHSLLKFELEFSRGGIKNFETIRFTNLLVLAVMLAISAKLVITFPHVSVNISLQTSPHIFKHLLSSGRCRQSCSTDCFEILDSAPAKFQLKLKEAMHINWEKPNRPFPNYLKPLPQSESWCSSFHMKMRFHSHVYLTHFHMNGCAPGLALIERLKATRKWAITNTFITLT